MNGIPRFTFDTIDVGEGSRFHIRCSAGLVAILHRFEKSLQDFFPYDLIYMEPGRCISGVVNPGNEIIGKAVRMNYLVLR